jgi:hypothetical protein
VCLVGVVVGVKEHQPRLLLCNRSSDSETLGALAFPFEGCCASRVAPVRRVKDNQLGGDTGLADVGQIVLRAYAVPALVLVVRMNGELLQRGTGVKVAFPVVQVDDCFDLFVRSKHNVNAKDESSGYFDVSLILAPLPKIFSKRARLAVLVVCLVFVMVLVFLLWNRVLCCRQVLQQVIHHLCIPGVCVHSPNWRRAIYPPQQTCSCYRSSVLNKTVCSCP